MGPWEKYQATPSAQPAAGGQPWLKYQQQTTPEPQQQIPVSQARTALDQGLQGATFGWADEITDPLGVAIGSFIKHPIDTIKGEVNDPDLADAITNVRQDTKERLKSEVQQHPVTAIGSNIAGGLLTSGALAATAPGTAIANGLRTGGTAARIAKGAVAGGVASGIYGAGAADEGHRLEGAAKAALPSPDKSIGENLLSGAVIGGAVPAAGALLESTYKGLKTAGKGALARSPEVLQDAAASMKSAAGELYNKMRDVGAVLNPQATQDLVDNIDAAISKQKFIPNLNPKTLAIVDDLKQAAQSGNLGLDELDQYRRLLSRVGGSEDGVSAGAARKAIDNMVSNLNNSHLVNGGADAVQLLKQGRAQYATAAKYEGITDILTKADGDPNRIKAGLTRFLNNDNNLKGFTPDELNALKNAARSSAPEKVLKMFGKFGIDLGSSLTPGNTIGPLIGGYVNPLTPVAGTAARQGQKYLARGKAENLLQLIESGGKAAGNTGKAISPLISAPAGELGSALSGMESPAASRALPQMPVNPASKYPTKIDIPAPMPGKQSSDTQPDFLKRLASVESNNNPDAKNPNSSAEGLYQFTNGTWRDMVQKYGKQYGITMKDRRDPEKATIMAGLLTKENTQILSNRLGRKPNEAELYAAHFLGPRNAARLIKNADNSNVIASSMFPKAAQSNRTIFYDGKRARRPAEILALFEDKLKKAKIEA